MMAYERDIIGVMRVGQNQHDPLVSSETWREVEEKHAHLSTSPRGAVEQILSGQDKIMGLEGVAGAGKTTSLAAVREGAEQEGYEVRGLAPTSRKAHKLSNVALDLAEAINPFMISATFAVLYLPAKPSMSVL